MREREKVFDPGRPMIRENKYRVEFLRASASTTILMKNCGSAGGFSLIQDPRELVGPREANFITLHFPISRLTLSKDKIHPTSNIPDTCIIFPSIEVEKKGEKTMLAL